MAIHRLLQNSAFAPEDIIPLVAAYEDCLRILKLSDRSDPITEMAQTGIRDSVQLGRLALEEIGISGSGWARAFNARAWCAAEAPMSFCGAASVRTAPPAAIARAVMRNGQPHEVRLSASGACARLFA
jgi:hypothetical protein